ncbi:GPP34 family phosphoprotein [Streptomyces sp. 378]|uniref:GOLPH3/VPS74 family protein n=1 Tax=Streptomyces sp. 378 TaxID=3049412 RepID=UPI0024C2A8B4|nr:GPP34 family phosphoprotein [Streptomyces sp. 378]MDK1342694.1 GPP34 family phosphoprotein [Streptomyces sp. 378]
MPNGPLTLPARLCLLAWDAARPAAGGTAHRPDLVRAGALVELAQRGLLTDADGIATPVDLDASAGDAVLDGLLDLVRESCPHPWRTWVKLRARVTFDAAREQLVAEGYLRADKRRVLGLFPSVEYALERLAVVEALRGEVRDVLRGEVAEVSGRDAAVVVLAAAAGLLPDREVRVHARRLEDLLERAGAAGPGPRRVVREVSTAMTTTTGSAPAPTAGG